MVLFEVDPAEPELFAVPLCDTCQDFPAAIWCPADMAKYVEARCKSFITLLQLVRWRIPSSVYCVCFFRLCEACDERLHSYNKLVSRHIRVPLNEVGTLVLPERTDYPPYA